MEKDVALTSKILLPICRGNLRLRLRFPAGVPLRGVEDEGGEEAASAGGAPVANERRVWVMFPSSCNSVEDARAFVASRFLAGSWLARPIHFFLQGYVVPGCEMIREFFTPQDIVEVRFGEQQHRVSPPQIRGPARGSDRTLSGPPTATATVTAQVPVASFETKAKSNKRKGLNEDSKPPKMIKNVPENEKSAALALGSGPSPAVAVAVASVAASPEPSIFTSTSINAAICPAIAAVVADNQGNAVAFSGSAGHVSFTDAPRSDATQAKGHIRFEEVMQYGEEANEHHLNQVVENNTTSNVGGLPPSTIYQNIANDNAPIWIKKRIERKFSEGDELVAKHASTSASAGDTPRNTPTKSITTLAPICTSADSKRRMPEEKAAGKTEEEPVAPLTPASASKSLDSLSSADVVDDDSISLDALPPRKRPYSVISSIHFDGSHSSALETSDISAAFESEAFELGQFPLLPKDIPLKIGDVIAYRTMTLSMDTWEPVLSPYAKAAIIAITYEDNTKRPKNQPLKNSDLVRMKLWRSTTTASTKALKTANNDKGSEVASRVVDVPWGEMVDVRVVKGPTASRLVKDGQVHQKGAANVSTHPVDASTAADLFSDVLASKRQELGLI